MENANTSARHVDFGKIPKNEKIFRIGFIYMNIKIIHKIINAILANIVSFLIVVIGDKIPYYFNMSEFNFIFIFFSWVIYLPGFLLKDIITDILDTIIWYFYQKHFWDSNNSILFFSNVFVYYFIISFVRKRYMKFIDKKLSKSDVSK